jgi:3-dehydroquinate synthase
MATGDRVKVSAPSRSYDVRVEAGLLDGLPALLAEYCPAHRYAVISDDHVTALHGQRLVEALKGAGLEIDLFSFPAGELHKTRAEWALLSDEMFAAGLGRDAAVLALGGGVTGDLAGFVAATYMRGLPLVQLPTTLLAMIDSSVGGKTGVDTPAGKNLIGAFLQPEFVAADIATLHTLPATEVRAGLAEAIKHGAIADAVYFATTQADLPALAGMDAGALQRLIVRSVEIKAEVVGRDERESGPRKMLNFGHTLGHAVEALSGYRLLHGEAISIGMVLEARLGERLGVTEAGTAERLAGVLAAAGLPTERPEGVEAAAVVAATHTDKKARRGQVEYALIEKIGTASAGADGGWGWAVDEAVVLEVLAPA